MRKILKVLVNSIIILVIALAMSLLIVAGMEYCPIITILIGLIMLICLGYEFSNLN